MEELLAFKAAPSSLDPEAWGSEGATLEASDDELYEAREQGRKGREVSRMRGSIDMGEDAAYVGKRASRERFFGADGKGTEKTIGRPGPSSSADEDEDSDSGSDGIEYRDELDGLNESERPLASVGRDNASNTDETDETDDGKSDDERRDAYLDPMEALEKEMLEAERAEAQAVEEMKDRQAKEYEKAKAVKAQKKLWQSGLEARIMMQKVMQGANKLPLPDVHRGLGDVDPVLAHEMQGVASDARRTLADLCDILDAVGDVNPAVVGGEGHRSKRVRENDGLTVCWAALDARYNNFCAFRDASLDRWHRKTVIESGGSASNLRILNQGISKQVSLLMKDVDRIAERSRMRAAEFQGLCRVDIVDGVDSNDDDAKDARGEVRGIC